MCLMGILTFGERKREKTTKNASYLTHRHIPFTNEVAIELFLQIPRHEDAQLELQAGQQSEKTFRRCNAFQERMGHLMDLHQLGRIVFGFLPRPQQLTPHSSCFIVWVNQVKAYRRG
jgi:hypothetical protein